MITKTDVKKILGSYKTKKITIGVLGGHSALDVCHGAKKHGFKTLAVCQKGREKTYDTYFKANPKTKKGCIDTTIIVDKFADITNENIQKQLRKQNTVFIHNRYFWVYCNYEEIESNFHVPIFGTRDMVRLEERDVEKNQYYLLKKAGIRLPKIFKSSSDIDRLVIVKVPEATRSYERAFFFATDKKSYEKTAKEMIKQKRITKPALKSAVIEEYALGAHVNFNFFYSPLSDQLELMGTDTRRQTNLDGFLRLPADQQLELLKHLQPKLIETGHYTVTIKESLIEKAFAIGERFVKVTKQEHPIGIIGPFALQGAVVAEEGREDIVIFDVSMRIPGSPGTVFTPYTSYLHGEPMSYGERIALEIKQAIKNKKLNVVCT